MTKIDVVARKPLAAKFCPACGHELVNYEENLGFSGETTRKVCETCKVIWSRLS